MVNYHMKDDDPRKPDWCRAFQHLERKAGQRPTPFKELMEMHEFDLAALERELKQKVKNIERQTEEKEIQEN
jgi:hypothetical protein